MLGTILIVILILRFLALCHGGGTVGDWGYAPTGGIGLVLMIVVVLLVLGRI